MTTADQEKINRFSERIPPGLIDHWNEILQIIEAETYLPPPPPENPRLLDRIQCLEAICLMHGITDLNLWLAKGSGFLTDQAVEFMRRGVVQAPEKLKNKYCFD